MAEVHMTEAEVASDFDAVLRRIAEGENVVVDRNGQPIAIIKPAEWVPKTLSEQIERAERRDKERGYPVTMDDDYARDVQQIVGRDCNGITTRLRESPS